MNSIFQKAFRSHIYADDVTVEEASELREFLCEMERDHTEDLRVKFYCAQAFELCGDLAGAAGRLNVSGLRPGRDFDDYDFDDHSRWAREFLFAQNANIGRGLPPLFLCSLPKSASALVTRLVSGLLELPKCRTSKGLFGKGRVVPTWLDAFLRGGACTHEHFPASPVNRNLLADHGVRRINVHVRHPADAVNSLYHHALKTTGRNHLAREIGHHSFPTLVTSGVPEGRDWFYKHFYPEYMSWLEGWVNFAAAGNVDVRFTRYEELLDDKARFVLDLLEFFDIQIAPSQYAKVKHLVEKIDSPEARKRSGNTFRKGARTSWETECSNSEKELMSCYDNSVIFDKFHWKRISGSLANSWI